jgi:hypothetical protein
MDMVSLIANIGGNLGLFMGVCLFSMGEMVVTLVEVLFLKCQTKSKPIWRGREPARTHKNEKFML